MLLHRIDEGIQRKERTVQLHLEGKEHRTLPMKLARMVQMKKLSALYYFC